MDEARERLRRRFGDSVDPWFDALPAVLAELAERWGLELGEVIQRGSVAVVICCGTAVLKISPDRTRIAHEARALAHWPGPHTPAVLAIDEPAGALLIEAIEPGTPLSAYPGTEKVGALLTALHASAPDPAYPTVAARVVYLFDAGLKNYERRTDLADVIPPPLYEHGRERALSLAGERTPAVLLHGDLTAPNVLDGGEERGLVAIDPAPCLGDPAFDAVDLVLFRAPDVDTIEARARQLPDGDRIFEWCKAFAAMAALEVAEAGGSPEPYLSLAKKP